MDVLRRIAVVATALAAVAAGQLNGSGRWGKSPAEFAADSDAVLRVAGWAFAIWAPLYVGVLAFAFWQARRPGDDPLIRLLAWPAALSFAGLAAWIWAAGVDAEALTVVVIVSAALALILPLWVGADRARAAAGWDRRLLVWPLAALAGWLTIASPVNLITVLAGNGDLPGPGAAWSFGAVLFAAAAALMVSRRIGTILNAVPIAWGLIGVASAEAGRNPPLAWAAGAAAAVTATGAFLAARRSGRPA